MYSFFKKSKLFFLVILCIIISSCNKQGVGTLMGGVTGGLAGATLGEGESKLITAGLGAVAGGLVGGAIGSYLDKKDKEMVQQVSYTALEHTPSGQAVSWDNPDSGHSGYVIAKPAFRANDGRYCREYVQTAIIGNKTQEVYGRACRQPDGTWEIVK